MLLKNTLARILGLNVKRSADTSAVDLTIGHKLQQKADYLSLDEMPRPTGMCPYIGSAIPTMTSYKMTNANIMILDRIRKLGKTYYDKIFAYECVNVADPIDAATVFRNEGKFPVRPELTAWKYPRDRMGIPLGIVLADGDLWYSYRRAMDHQLMVHNNLYKYVPALNEIAGDYIQVLLKNQAQNPAGHVQDLKHEQFRWSMESISRFLYDKRLGCLRPDGSPMPEDIKKFANAVDVIFQTSQVLAIMSTMTARILVPITLWKHNRAWSTVFRIGRQ